MVFSGLLFTFFFLPVVLILYYCGRGQYRNYVLLIASLGFYAYGEPLFVFVMLGSIFINYGIAMLIDRYRGRRAAKVSLVVAAVLNIGLIFIYKYLDFAIDITNEILHSKIKPIGMELPIGISFFTFQILSYVIDVYRGTVKVQKNPFMVGLYISLFPQLIAGPIVRYKTIADQIKERKSSVELFADGIRRFMIGMAKKVILANNLAIVAQKAFAGHAQLENGLFLWIGAICFSLQIYYDFSGYSDMAIGLGKLFGFRFEENFKDPYISKSVTEFWRRWHISLGQWFRDYVYIPLGGSRVSKYRHILNMLIVWLLTGIWHGANYTFIVWGLWYFVLLVAEKQFVKPEMRSGRLFKFFWQIVTLLSVLFGWVMFNSKTVIGGLRYCGSMFGLYGNSFRIEPETIFYLKQYGIFMLLGILLATPLMKMLKAKLADTKAAHMMAVLEPVGYGILFLWAVSFLILGAHNPFIYFNF